MRAMSKQICTKMSSYQCSQGQFISELNEINDLSKSRTNHFGTSRIDENTSGRSSQSAKSRSQSEHISKRGGQTVWSYYANDENDLTNYLRDEKTMTSDENTETIDINNMSFDSRGLYCANGQCPKEDSDYPQMMSIERISDIGSDFICGGGLDSLIKQSAALRRKNGMAKIHSRSSCRHSKQPNRICYKPSTKCLVKQGSNENSELLPSGLGSTMDTEFLNHSASSHQESSISEHSNTSNDGQFNPQTPYSYKLQYDPKPLVVYKNLRDPPAIYRQNVIIRYYKPPKLSPPGPIVIREIRSPQKPIAPPLVIRQRMPTPITPPPLILRECPPKPPKTILPQVILKRLPSLPRQPRQVIIERYPPLPPKPRDIIIERWMPYEVDHKRKVIYQVAPDETKVSQTTPKNIVITYQQKKPVVKTVIRRLGVIDMEPQEYMAKYGESVLNTSTLLSKVHETAVFSKLNLNNFEDHNINGKDSLWIDSEDVYGFSNVSVQKSSPCSCKCHCTQPVPIKSSASLERIAQEKLTNEIRQVISNHDVQAIESRCCYDGDNKTPYCIDPKLQNQLVNSIMDSVTENLNFRGMDHRGEHEDKRSKYTILDNESLIRDDYKIYSDDVGSIGKLLEREIDLNFTNTDGMRLYPNSSHSKISDVVLHTEVENETE